MEKPPVLKQIEAILRAEETADIEPPWSCLPVGDTKWIELKAKRIEPLIQQARQDIAREIFEESENNCIHNPMYIKRRCDTCWQSLESKYLIPPNPVGSADL